MLRDRGARGTTYGRIWGVNMISVDGVRACCEPSRQGREWRIGWRSWCAPGDPGALHRIRVQKV